MDYSLKELLDIPKLCALLESLDELHSIPSAIVDTDGTILTATAWQEICTEFHRRNPESEKQCIESDCRIAAELDIGTQQVIYRCPLGLIDAAMPIALAGRHIGNVFTGQLFLEPPDEAAFVEQARRYGFDEAEYLTAMRKVPLLSESKLRKNLSFLHSLTLMLAEQGLQYKQLQQTEAELRENNAKLATSKKRLQESEARFRALHDASFGGIMIHDKGLILDCNQGLSDLYGYSRAELIGMNGFELVAPGSYEQVKMNASRGHSEAFEAEGLRKDGTTFPLTVRGKNITYQGREIRVIEIQDISERKRVEDALQESEKSLRDLIEQSPIGLALCRMDGSLVDLNPAYADIIGYSIEDALQLSYWDVTPQKYADDEQRQLESLEKTGQYGPYEKEYRHKDGHLVPVRLNGMIVERKGERFIWSSVEDITVLKQAEADKLLLTEQLRQSQKMEAIGTLAGGVAHDFNNILSAILGYTELVMRNDSCDNKSQRQLRHVISAAERARELVKQILMFSRKGEKSRESVKLSDVVYEATRLLRNTIPASVNIRLDVDQATGYVAADSTQLHQVVMNLCTNAYHSLPEQRGEISIGLKPVEIDAITAAKYPNLRQGDYGQLSVSDNGSGIDPDIMPRIFDPFFTTKQQGQGTGMGLAVIHGIVQGHDGAIGVESSVGRGSTFTVFFPLCDQRPQNEMLTAEHETAPQGSEHILLVDDEAMLIDIGKETLETMGYQVTATTSPQEALQLIEASPEDYSLLLTDQTMPEMSGDVLAKRAMLVRADLPVIICTGHSAVLNEQKAHAIGVKALLMKPLDFNNLNREIRILLD